MDAAAGERGVRSHEGKGRSLEFRGQAVAVSACLLGEPCRYDGASKPCEAILVLRDECTFVPVCPEVAGGLPTPRVPSEIVVTEGVRRVMNAQGEDVTAAFERGARQCVDEARERGCTAAILKAKSPSCGSGVVYDGTFSGALAQGWGVAAELFRAEGFLVVSEDDW